jgi:hypothetical protein
MDWWFDCVNRLVDKKTSSIWMAEGNAPSDQLIKDYPLIEKSGIPPDPERWSQFH